MVVLIWSGCGSESLDQLPECRYYDSNPQLTHTMSASVSVKAES